MAGDLNERLTAVESYIAESCDDNDPIRLSEITDQIQQVIHEQEKMLLKVEGLENRISANNRLTVAIGAAVALLALLELLTYGR